MTQIPNRASPPATGSQTVLVIDDDASALELIRRALSRGGLHVVTAASGAEGLRLAHEVHPRLVFLDVVMPDLDGWAVLTRLKADPQTAHLPVFMTTMIDERNRAQTLGAAGYLLKPVSRAQLLAVVEQHLQEAEAAPRPILVVEDDADNREILTRVLRRRGLPVVEAENGLVALQLVAQARPALILLDLMLPGMDGLSFVRELDHAVAGRAIPIVVLTAKTLSASDRLQLGDLVRKVFQKGSYTRDDLLREINRWYEPAPAGA
jgi:CheY-like chemotaxis protein